MRTLIGGDRGTLGSKKGCGWRGQSEEVKRREEGATQDGWYYTQRVTFSYEGWTEGYAGCEVDNNAETPGAC